MRLSSLPSIAVLVAGLALAPVDALATDAPIAVGEVSPPPPNAGIDVAAIRVVAEHAIREIDTTSLARRRVVVSIALRDTPADGPVVCTVNATLRDARTGAMIAIIEAGARAEGPGSVAVRKQVAEGAVRRAVGRIPTALGAK